MHKPATGWALSGTPEIVFLYDAAHGYTDTKTWLYTGAGFWRTTDAGESWTVVEPNAGSPHGYNQIFRSKTGALYAGSWQYPYRSADNGQTWQQLANNGLPYSGYYAVCGNGEDLFVMPDPGSATASWYTSKESDGLTWKPYTGGGDQAFVKSPISVQYDSVTHIMYSCQWTQGLWAMQVSAPSTLSPPISQKAAKSLAQKSHLRGQVNIPGLGIGFIAKSERAISYLRGSALLEVLSAPTRALLMMVPSFPTTQPVVASVK